MPTMIGTPQQPNEPMNDSDNHNITALQHPGKAIAEERQRRNRPPAVISPDVTSKEQHENTTTTTMAVDPPVSDPKDADTSIMEIDPPFNAPGNDNAPYHPTDPAKPSRSDSLTQRKEGHTNGRGFARAPNQGRGSSLQRHLATTTPPNKPFIQSQINAMVAAGTIPDGLPPDDIINQTTSRYARGLRAAASTSHTKPPNDQSSILAPILNKKKTPAKQHASKEYHSHNTTPTPVNNDTITPRQQNNMELTITEPHEDME
jgi:hypothetical protein